MERVLNDLRKRLAGNVLSLKQMVAGTLPSCRAIMQDLNIRISQPSQPPGGALRNAVGRIDQYDRRRASWNYRRNLKFQSAVWDVYRQKRMSFAVLPLFPDIEQCNFVAAGEAAA